MDRRRCSQVLSILISFYLQDQYDQIAVHTQKGIDFLEKYGHFVDARSKIEAEYASKLRWEARSCPGTEMPWRDDSRLYFIYLLPVILGHNKTLKLTSSSKNSTLLSPGVDRYTRFKFNI